MDLTGARDLSSLPEDQARKDALSEGYSLYAATTKDLAWLDACRKWKTANRRYFTTQAEYDKGAEWNEFDLLFKQMERHTMDATAQSMFGMSWEEHRKQYDQILNFGNIDDIVQKYTSGVVTHRTPQPTHWLEALVTAVGVTGLVKGFRSIFK